MSDPAQDRSSYAEEGPRSSKNLVALMNALDPVEQDVIYDLLVHRVRCATIPGSGVYPVVWRDEDGAERNTWSRNRLTGEIEPDPDGDPLYTTTAPGVERNSHE